VVVSANARFRRTIVTALDAAGLRGLEASTPSQAIVVATITAPAIAVVYLVDDAGTRIGVAAATCRAIRAHSSAPIIAIVDPRKPAHQVRLLAEVADDWFTRPRHRREIIERVLHYVRRLDHKPQKHWPMAVARYDASAGAMVCGVFVADGVLIDFDRHCTRRDGQRLRVSKTEWRILGSLARAAGNVVPRQTVLNEVWNGSSVDRAARRMRVHLTHLRRKLERVPGAPRVILTEPGFGYRLAAEPMRTRSTSGDSRVKAT
jgi:two-component system KDP operon response regulator KdpE